MDWTECGSRVYLVHLWCLSCCLRGDQMTDANFSISWIFYTPSVFAIFQISPAFPPIFPFFTSPRAIGDILFPVKKSVKNREIICPPILSTLQPTIRKRIRNSEESEGLKGNPPSVPILFFVSQDILNEASFRTFVVRSIDFG